MLLKYCPIKCCVSVSRDFNSHIKIHFPFSTSIIDLTFSCSSEVVGQMPAQTPRLQETYELILLTETKVRLFKECFVFLLRCQTLNHIETVYCSSPLLFLLQSTPHIKPGPALNWIELIWLIGCMKLTSVFWQRLESTVTTLSFLYDGSVSWTIIHYYIMMRLVKLNWRNHEPPHAAHIVCAALTLLWPPQVLGISICWQKLNDWNSHNSEVHSVHMREETLGLGWTILKSHINTYLCQTLTHS